MRILVFGGTFNPPHRGHDLAARSAADLLDVQKTLLIPTYEPPHKHLDENSAGPEDRLRMTELAAEYIPDAEVLDIELQRKGKSYTSDTLKILAEQYPDDELIFLVGTDMLLSLSSWHEPETICSLASIAVFARERGTENEIFQSAEHLRREFGATVYIVEGEPFEISSTELREKLKRRRGSHEIREKVYGYIIQKRLYGAKPDLMWLRGKAHSFLAPKRIPHVLGVEAEAVSLAKRWGVDTGDAAEAAICHDITKKLGVEEQLSLCAKYDIMTDDLEKVSEKLLHAKTGAALSSDLFGVSEEVALAIRFHTTGRPGMTRLEMITYLADYIEPNRSGFPGLEELRKTAYEDLDQAMELAMRMSLDEVRQRGNPAHHNTIEGRDWYRNNLRRRGLAPVHADGVPDAEDQQQ